MMSSLIAFGGNLGDVPATFRAARSAIAELAEVQLTRFSSLYDSTPVGSISNARYINAAAQVKSSLNPDELLDAMQQIETSLGRERTVHWGSRTLDLDIISYGDKVIDSERLSIPHPACWYRRFVLDPVVEIAPEWVHPLLQETSVELRTHLLQRPLPVFLSFSMSAQPEILNGISDVMLEFPVTMSGPNSAALSFSTGSCALNNKCIDLTDEEQPVEMLRAVLTAALDEPKRLTSAT